jgi:hypothetical protein
VVDLCRSVAKPQRDLSAQASPSCTRSPDPKVVAQSLVDDVRTATPPPATDEREATPLPANETGAGGAVGDIGASASPRVIDVGGSQILDARGDLVCVVIPEGQIFRVDFS